MWQPVEDSDPYDELAETSARLNHVIDAVDTDRTPASTLRRAAELLERAIEVLTTTV